MSDGKQHNNDKMNLQSPPAIGQQCIGLPSIFFFLSEVGFWSRSCHRRRKVDHVLRGPEQLLVCFGQVFRSDLLKILHVWSQLDSGFLFLYVDGEYIYIYLEKKRLHIVRRLMD